MTNVRYAPEDYRDIETVNLYRERWEQLSDYSDNKKERSAEILRPYEASMYYVKKISAQLR